MWNCSTNVKIIRRSWVNLVFFVQISHKKEGSNGIKSHDQLYRLNFKLLPKISSNFGNLNAINACTKFACLNIVILRATLILNDSNDDF